MPSHSTPVKLSRHVAAQILDRAASLDVTDERIDLATLRASALDAGISADAFERALVESISMTPPAVRESQPQPSQPQRMNFYELLAKVSVFGTMGGLLAIAVVSVLVGDGPDEDVMLGFAVGGIGIIAGIVTYFKGKLRG